MHLSVLAAAAEVPDQPALGVDGQVLSYHQLAEHVRRTLVDLHARGIAATTPRVALSGHNRLPTLLTVYALIELGVPVVLLHPSLTATERQGLLGDCQPAVYLDPPEVPADPPEVPATSGIGHQGLFSPVPEVLPEVPATSGTTLPDDRRPLAILFTSGTTGRPRGAVLSRNAFVAAARASAANLGWHRDDRWLLSLPIAHVGGLSILTRCLIARRCAVVHGASRFDAAEVVRVIEDQRVTLLSLVPTTLRRLLDLHPPWQPPGHLRAILLGGAAAPPRLLAEAAGRRWPVLTTYGLTEACSQVTTQRYADLAAGRLNRGELGAGEPMEGVEVRVIDGGVQVRGPSLMTGYLAAGPQPFTADGWLITGDLGRLDAHGRLHLHGRRADLIVSGGENVYPVEVEQVLEQHPGIAAACVFGLPDDLWGELVAAALVPAEGQPPPDAELLAFCQRHLARHKRPRHIAYLDELPSTRAGKLDRAAAARQARERLRPLA